MLLTFIVEYRELADAVCDMLHPRDVVALAHMCRESRVLRSHRAYVHATALAPLLRAIARIRYRVLQFVYYLRRGDGWKIIRSSTLLSRRDCVEYYTDEDPCMEYFGMQQYDTAALSTTISDFECDPYVVMPTVQIYDLDDIWPLGLLTLVQLLCCRTGGVWRHIVARLCVRDIAALACTCRLMCRSLRN